MLMLLVILFWLILGALCSYVAKQRGRHPLLWFILGFSIGFIALLILFFLPSKKESFLLAKKSKVAAPSLKTAESSSNKSPYLVEENQKLLTPPAYHKLWYYLDDKNKQYGPMSFQALKRAWREKTINASTYVWNEDMNEWQPLKDLSSIMSHIRTPSLNGTPETL